MISYILNFFMSRLIKDTNTSFKIENTPFILIVLVIPIIEEIIFRGCLQRLIKSIQGFLPKKLETPSLRVLITASYFASYHLSNSGGYLTKSQAIIQCLGILLYPIESIIYERRSLLMSIISHMTNNLCCYTVFKMLY